MKKKVLNIQYNWKLNSDMADSVNDVQSAVVFYLVVWFGRI